MSARSKTRYAILGMLSLESKSGYDIKKQIEEGFSTFWSESFGQIYKVFKQLENERLVEKKHISQKGRPSKDVYSITETGKSELKKYLSTPPDKLVVRDEMMLKLIFGFNVPKENSIDLLEHEIKKQVEKLQHIESKASDELEKSKIDDNAKIHISLMIKLAREFLKTKVRWCKEAIKLLNETEPLRKSSSNVKEHV